MPPKHPITIDLDRVIAQKSPRLAKWLPRFVMNYLKRTVHQEEVNRILSSYADRPPVEFIRATLEDMQISYSSLGMEKLDPKGRYLFVCNHPFGGMDGLMLGVELDRHFGAGRIIVNDLLMNLKPLAPLFIPINKHGQQNSQYASGLKAALQGEEPIATFPAGLCSRRTGGVIEDLPWKASFVKSAIESEREIVPIYFEGRLSNFFYNLANLRTRMGVKFNIEMLYLVDEMFAQRGKHFTILVGDPIPWQALKNAPPQQRCLEVRSKVYALKSEPR